MSTATSTGCTYSKFFIRTSKEQSSATTENLIGTAAELSDFDSKFAASCSDSAHEAKLLNSAEEAGIERNFTVFPQKNSRSLDEQAFDESTLVVVSDDQSNLDLYQLECDTLFVKS